jgi:hypothetical protein
LKAKEKKEERPLNTSCRAAKVVKNTEKNDRMLVSSLLNKKPPEKSGGLLVIEQKVREKLSST